MPSELAEKLAREMLSIAEPFGGPHRWMHVRKLMAERADEILAEHEVLPLTAEERFEVLAGRWRRGRPRGLGVHLRIDHPAYRQIVAMGTEAVPFILRELQERPDHWFPALHEITGANPVPEDQRGKIRGMIDAWVAWGREQGYIEGGVSQPTAAAEQGDELRGLLAEWTNESRLLRVISDRWWYCSLCEGEDDGEPEHDPDCLYARTMKALGEPVKTLAGEDAAS